MRQIIDGYIPQKVRSTIPRPGLGCTVLQAKVVLEMTILSRGNWSFRLLIYSRRRPSNLSNSEVQNYSEEGKRMNLKRWSALILIMGLILAFTPPGAQAEPYPGYHHPRGHAYGWHGSRRHGFERRHKHFRGSSRGPLHHRHMDRVYTGPPRVSYIEPVPQVVGIPYVQPQPYYSPPATPGLSGHFEYNF